ncbi:MAG TPA: helix-turn-helix transcriptional regulator [Candidatus Avidehalobacter gallistercoris]|uniref:Helix-turn-helix transcriptional regulator n=1 Tax=Candidatus Avidehalobacter gallistercoris TaxID=2840694 RepID=A0A9D1KZ00_9FIRM|nr:helix-turn-helix transcriptional regulator [Candidatus Avidehalobacter gallistercoris]
MFRRLRDLREDNDLTQRVVAEYLQCTQVCYSYYEIGKRDIPVADMVKLAKFYNVSVDYLLGLTDESTPYPPPKKRI